MAAALNRMAAGVHRVAVLHFVTMVSCWLTRPASMTSFCSVGQHHGCQSKHQSKYSHSSVLSNSTSGWNIRQHIRIPDRKTLPVIAELSKLLRTLYFLTGIC